MDPRGSRSSDAVSDRDAAQVQPGCTLRQSRAQFIGQRLIDSLAQKREKACQVLGGQAIYNCRLFR